MKHKYFKLLLFAIVGLTLFSSCVIEDDIEPAYVSVNSVNVYTDTYYDGWGNEYNEHDVHFSVFNEGDLHAYNVMLEFSFYTANGSVFYRNVSLGELHEYGTYSSNLFMEFTNDYIEGYDVNVTWVD